MQTTAALNLHGSYAHRSLAVRPPVTTNLQFRRHGKYVALGLRSSSIVRAIVGNNQGEIHKKLQSIFSEDRFFEYKTRIIIPGLRIHFQSDLATEEKNNLAYGLMLKEVIHGELAPRMTKLCFASYKLTKDKIDFRKRQQQPLTKLENELTSFTLSLTEMANSVEPPTFGKQDFIPRELDEEFGLHMEERFLTSLGLKYNLQKVFNDKAKFCLQDYKMCTRQLFGGIYDFNAVLAAMFENNIDNYISSGHELKLEGDLNDFERSKFNLKELRKLEDPIISISSEEDFKNEDGNDIVTKLSFILAVYEEVVQIIEKLK